MNRKLFITKKAKLINRNPNLFHQRLYPYHKVNNNNNNKIINLSLLLKNQKDNSFENNNNNHISMKKRSLSCGNIFLYNNKNNNKDKDNNNNDNNKNAFNINLTQLKYLSGIDNLNTFNIYRTSKNKSRDYYYKTQYDYNKNNNNIKKYFIINKKKENLNEFNSSYNLLNFNNKNDYSNNYDNNNNDNDNNQGGYLFYNSQTSKDITYSISNSFTFSPKLNKNSKIIAEKLEDTWDRLLKKRKNFKENSHKEKNNINNINFSTNYFEEEKFNYSNIKDNNNYYSIYSHENNSNKNKKNLNININFIDIGNGIKIPSRAIKLYDKGLLNIKKRVLKSAEKIQNDNLFFKTFSYKPNLNKNKDNNNNNNKNKNSLNSTINKIKIESKSNTINNDKGKIYYKIL